MFIRCQARREKGWFFFTSDLIASKYHHSPTPHPPPPQELKFLMDDFKIIFGLQVFDHLKVRPTIPTPKLKLLMENFDTAETTLCTVRLPCHWLCYSTQDRTTECWFTFTHIEYSLSMLQICCEYSMTISWTFTRLFTNSSFLPVCREFSVSMLWLFCNFATHELWSLSSCLRIFHQKNRAVYKNFALKTPDLSVLTFWQDERSGQKVLLSLIIESSLSVYAEYSRSTYAK